MSAKRFVYEIRTVPLGEDPVLFERAAAECRIAVDPLQGCEFLGVVGDVRSSFYTDKHGNVHPTQHVQVLVRRPRRRK